MKRKCLITVLAVYLLMLFRITVFRSGVTQNELFSGEINLVPIVDWIDTYKSGMWNFIYLFFGNIVTFVPLGYIIMKLKRIGIGKIAMVGFCVSLVIEILQFVFASGISEINDLILNTLGTFGGGVLALIWKEE